MNAKIAEYLNECLYSLPEGMTSIHFDLFTTIDGYGIAFLNEAFGQQLNPEIEISTDIGWELFLEDFKCQLESLDALLRTKGISVVSYGFVDGDLDFFHV